MTEPLAIVGAACRLPGGIDGLGALWEALLAGRDLVTEVPADRFDVTRFVDPEPERPGRSFTAAGGFRTDISGFDADYFGMSPREASRLDPQHRMLLELTAEVFDDAGVPAESVAGTEVGVFVGASNMDYWELQNADPDSINAYTVVGGVLGNNANRVSYLFDLRGPSLALDTACSSALVALHHAAEYVRHGAGRTALAAGVNLLLSPHPFVGFGKAGLLSRTGRCHTFSRLADGYVRAEGAGAVLIKRLPDAVGDGDRIHAVLWGTATNNDGRTNGITQPSRQAQEDLLREVYGRFQVGPDELVYFEAHGTGTPVGDATECAAVGTVLGRGRARPLPIGSVKTNLGHLESASGMASLMKALLVLRHGVIPASLHGLPRNPAIDFDGLGLAPVDENQRIDPTARSLIGIGNYGFGGSNAHAIVGALCSTPWLDGAAPVPPSASAPRPRATLPVVVSGQSETAVAVAAGRLADHIAETGPDGFYDIAYTTARRRGRHTHRVAVLADDPHEAEAALRGMAAGSPDASAGTGRAVADGRVVFAFAGNGSQWPGMGLDLLDTEPSFAGAVSEVDDELSPLLGWSVLDALKNSDMTATEVAQPCLFAVQIGLVELLARYGVRPDAVYGHSVGEIAAAHVCGALSRGEAARIVWARSAAQATTAGMGAMAAVGLTADAARQALAEFGDALELAAINSGTDVTVSGRADALGELGSKLTAHGVYFKILPIDYAFHSALLDHTEPTLRRLAGELHPTEARIPFISTVTGTELSGADLDVDYWWRNLRQPVRFADATQVLLRRRFDTVCEIGPHPVLRHYLRQQLPATGAALSTLRREGSGSRAVRATVATLIASGARVDWDRYFPERGTVVELPAYPWQRQRYWNGSPRTWDRGNAGVGSDHPLLGNRLDLVAPTWWGRVDVNRAPWLGDHFVHGALLVPGAALVELTLAAAARTVAERGQPVEAHTMRVDKPLVLPANPAETLSLQVSVSEDAVVRIATRSADAAQWRPHSRARVRALHAPAPEPVDLSAHREGPTDHLGSAEFYRILESMGVRLGGGFAVLTEIWANQHEALAGYHLRVPADGYAVHPIIVDGSIQVAAAILHLRGLGLRIPVSYASVRLWRTPEANGFVHARVRALTERDLVIDVRVTDPAGAVAMEITGCRLRPLLGTVDNPVQLMTTELRAATPSTQPVAATPLPALPELLAGLTGFRQTAAAVDDFYPELIAHVAARNLDRLLGQAGAVGFRTVDLIAAGVAPKYLKLMKALLRLMARHGLAESTQDGWRLTGPAALGERFRQAAVDHPDHVAELSLLGHADRHLAEVLRGEHDPVELMFSVQSADATSGFYDVGPLAVPFNQRARAAVRRIVQGWPADRPLRILEVGAGTGGLTGWLLPELPADRTRYVFTDLSDAFFTKAATRFAAYDFVEYRKLNLDVDPWNQGFPPGGFDLVVAGNSVHTATDVRRSLRGITDLLGPGGHLLLMEVHARESALLPWSLLDGWWAATGGELRPDWPLLSPDTWREVLADSGFAEIARIGTDTPDRDFMTVTLARKAGAVAAPTPAVSPSHSLSRWRSASGNWLVAVIGDGEDELAAAVTDRLGGRLVEAATDPARWSARLGSGGHIVLILGAPPRDHEAAFATTVARFEVLRAIAGVLESFDVAVHLVTRPCGAQPHLAEPIEPVDAALWGATRSLAAEHPRGTIRRIALDRGERDAERLCAELRTPSDEDEVVLTLAGRFVPRVLDQREPTKICDRFALDVREPGRSFRLAWVEAEVPRPGRGEVTVEVKAAGVNPIQAYGMAGVLADAEVPDRWSAVEIAGVVTGTGPGVTRWQVGDRVFGLGTSGLGSHTLARETHLARVPDAMGCAEAATLPFGGLVAAQLGTLTAKDTLFVHGAAGASGLVPIQYAQSVGARVIATAGTDLKRDFLRLTGVDLVLDSRDPGYADAVLRATGGNGADVVINCGSGEATTRNLELVAAGGRYLELNKVDLYSDRNVTLRLFTGNVRYLAYALDWAIERDQDTTAEQFAEVARRVHDGRYRPLPYRAFPAARVDEAFRALLRSRHIGKLVITLDEPVPVWTRPAPVRLDPDGAYLVTGGLSGLGVKLAGWLADRGASHIALVGRRGSATPGAETVIAELARRGATATMHAADITDAPAVRAIIDGLDAPLRGIVHAATVLDDGTLDTLTPQRIHAVLAPKMRGAAILDELTRDRDLDLFLLIGSAAALLGFDGQSHYAAGNTYLEALARQRRAAGLPATVLALGQVGEVGWLARHQDVGAHLVRRGIGVITPPEILAALDHVIGNEVTVGFAGRFDWALAAPFYTRGAPRFGALASELGGTIERTETRDQVAGLDGHEAQSIVADLVAGLVAAIVDRGPEGLDRSVPLEQFGVDSLMSTELTDRIRRELGAEISVTRVLGSSGIDDLARHILECLC